VPEVLLLLLKGLSSQNKNNAEGQNSSCITAGPCGMPLAANIPRTCPLTHNAARCCTCSLLLF
jgi:hypothetical protein